MTTKNFSVLHTADWHLRDSQYANPSRGDDFTKAAMAVIDVAMAHGVKAICNCGDILNNRRPSSRNIKDLVEIDKRLQAAGIPMYVISGNHDFARPSWISILYEESRNISRKNGGIIDADNKLLTIPDTDATVYGVPAMGATAFRELRNEWLDADILMSHELVSDFAAFKTEEDCLTIEDYPTERYQALLLGDIHTSAYKWVKTEEDAVLIGYPGSIELCSKNEPVDKTISIVDFVDGKLEKNPIPRACDVPSRKALFYRVLTDDQAEQALDDLKPHIDKNPIVLVKYDRKMHTVPQMFMTVLAGTDAILRCASFTDIDAARLLNGDEEVNLEYLKKMKDFVSDFLTPGTELHATGTALCDSEADHRRIITDYIHGRLENESDTFEDPGLRSTQVVGQES